MEATVSYATKVYQFIAKYSEIKYYTLCLGNVSKDCTINNMKKKAYDIVTGLSGDYNAIDTNIIFDIHNEKKRNVTQCQEL